MSGTHTYWRMTINNYDATDLALVQQGYPEHVRQMVYTLEQGEEGTPHIQAYIRMKRDCRLSMMKKLFPRGNFGSLDSSEYQLNSQRYAQKLDATATSPATITNWEPLLTIEGVMKQVIEKVIEDYPDDPELELCRIMVEREMVRGDYKYAKVFVSATYKQMWKQFGHDMYHCLFHQKYDQPDEKSVEISIPTHTHTHSEKIFSREGGIKDADENRSCSESSQESPRGDDCEDDEDSGSQTTSDETTSIGSGDSQTDDSTEYSE